MFDQICSSHSFRGSSIHAGLEHVRYIVEGLKKYLLSGTVPGMYEDIANEKRGGGWG